MVQQLLATAAVLLFSMGTALATGPLEVKLTVQERLGVARAEEPVTSGVPLPKGAVKDVAELTLLDSAGNPVPVQFAAANRWWDDGSIKWAHVDFAASVPANGTAVYTLKQGGAKANFKSPLAVKQTDAGCEVNTGPMKFTVGAKGNRLFDSVSLGGKTIISGGLGIALHNAGPGGRTFTASRRRITIEEQGPMKVVLLISGQGVPLETYVGEKKPPDIYGLDYKIRIYSYANSTLLKVVYTLENRRGPWSDHFDISSWFISCEVNRGDGGELGYRLGFGDKPQAGKVGKGQSARVEVLATDLYRCIETENPDGNPKDKTLLEGDPHKENPAWLGAADVTGPAGGVTVMVRNFWQLWAKNLGVGGIDGLYIGLWTNNVRDKGITTFVDKGGNLQFFAGVARTHEMWFNFHGPDVADPFPAVAAAREPLFARCEPAWYCQGTQVFGDLSEADPAAYQPAFKDKVAALNQWAEQSVKTPLKRWQTVKAGKNGAVDSFGMLNYGDGVEEQNDGLEPTRIHWEGGYYDYMHSIYLQFARTGDPFYLWLATDMSSHNADIHHTHHDTEGGRSRYCPSWGHIIMDEVNAPYASGTFNHWKNLSAFERWYLTGDHRAREAAMETMVFAMKLGNSGIDFSQPRSICHGLYGFWAGYDATGDKKYLEAMAKFAKAVAAKIDKGEKMGSGGWQRGMALQGLCWYVEKTGDESVVPAIVKSLERDWNDGTAELAYAHAFMWKRTGEPKYFFKAVRQLGGKADIWMQRFGNYGRSKLFIPTIVRQDAPRPAPATQPSS